MSKPRSIDVELSGAGDLDNAPKGAELTETTQELFLPIHRYVRLYPEELALIDHPAFQRLRRIRQLGFAHIVFPGATHSRFEHSLGAVHVAQRIVTSVNENYDAVYRNDGAPKQIGNRQLWQIARIDDPVARLIRLAALLHDIGHLPYGHTLEDELHHLSQHDGLARLARVCKPSYSDYDVDPKLFAPTDLPKPADGWSLEALINALYKLAVSAMGISTKLPFEVLSHVICKPKGNNDETANSWSLAANEIGKRIPLGVCRDVVGNTICADFLDYIYRDWYHIGKPFTEDERLFQYMEVRQRGKTNSEASEGESKFLINVGALDKIRHDALTNILDLLQARYKLAETVIFHRTKLALIGLLDRCMLELRALYQAVGLEVTRDLMQAAEDLLLDGSDDAIAEILLKLKDGTTEAAQEQIKQAINAEATRLAEEVANPGRQPELMPRLGPMAGPLMQRQRLIEGLVKRLKSRHIYSLAFKLRMSDIPGIHAPRNQTLLKFIAMYGDPSNRQRFLHAAEAMLSFPEGSLLMYVPPDGEMNAKIAKVNVLIEGQVSEFYSYEEEHGADASLTRGALAAQVRRFYELWSAQIFVEPGLWYSLSARQRNHFRNVVKGLLGPCDDQVEMRTSLQGSLAAVHRALPKAARAGTIDTRKEQLTNAKYHFPNGVPFSDEEG